MDRRKFLKSTSLSTGLWAINRMGTNYSKGMEMEDKVVADSNRPQLPQRPYGKTGVKLSIIGFGGIVVMDAEQKHANRVVAEAFEQGVNYYDVAPTYGNAELKLGPALEPYRKKVFLACKTHHRTRPGAQEELQQSLERLRTDHLDLYQLHALSDVKKDVDVVFSKGGAMEVFLEAKKAGKIRFLGFSAHTEEAALAAMDRYDFDSILFPVNFATMYKGKFGSRVIEKAKSKELAILALKAMARQQWPKDAPHREQYSKCWYEPVTKPDIAELALRFTLSQPITAAIPPGEEPLFRLAVKLAMNFKPLSKEDQGKIKILADGLDPIFTAQKTMS